MRFFQYVDYGISIKLITPQSDDAGGYRKTTIARLTNGKPKF
jgi:hypothetical protein